MRQLTTQQAADDAPFSSFHWRVLALCFFILVLDGYDLAIAGAALPAIMADLGVSASTAGFMASSALFGMMFGAMGLGSLADRIGRRRVIVLSVLLFSLFTAAAGLCRDPWSFSLMRFLAGIGLGSAIPNIISHVTEYSPRRVRGLAVTAIGSGYPLGSMFAAILGKQFIVSHGWQTVFFIAGAALLLIPVILKALPESLSYLVKNGRMGEAQKIVSHLVPEGDVGTSNLHLPSNDESAARAPIRSLFLDGRSLSTVLLWVAFATNLFLLYALSTWLVQLLTRSGYSLGSALTFLVIFNAGGILGALGGGWLGDRTSLKWTLAGLYALCASVLTLLGLGDSAVSIYVLLALLGASTTGSQIVLYALVGQYYPTLMRSTGLGFAAGVGRIGGILAPVVIGFIVAAHLPLAVNFFVIAAVAAIGAFAVGFVSMKYSASA